MYSSQPSKRKLALSRDQRGSFNVGSDSIFKSVFVKLKRRTATLRDILHARSSIYDLGRRKTSIHRIKQSSNLPTLKFSR